MVRVVVVVIMVARNQVVFVKQVFTQVLLLDDVQLSQPNMTLQHYKMSAFGWLVKLMTYAVTRAVK